MLTQSNQGSQGQLASLNGGRNNSHEMFKWVQTFALLNFNNWFSLVKIKMIKTLN